MEVQKKNQILNSFANCQKFIHQSKTYGKFTKNFAIGKISKVEPKLKIIANISGLLKITNTNMNFVTNKLEK